MLLGFCHARFACLPECQQVYWAWVTWCLWQETRTGKLALDFALEHSEEYEILQLEAPLGSRVCLCGYGLASIRPLHS